MSKPIKLREIAQCATDLLSQSEDADARTQALRVLALLALVREGRTHIKARRARCLNKSHRQTWPTCQLCEAEDVWLAKVRDEEPR